MKKLRAFVSCLSILALLSLPASAPASCPDPRDEAAMARVLMNLGQEQGVAGAVNAGKYALEAGKAGKILHPEGFMQLFKNQISEIRIPSFIQGLVERMPAASGVWQAGRGFIPVVGFLATLQWVNN